MRRTITLSATALLLLAVSGCAGESQTIMPQAGGDTPQQPTTTAPQTAPAALYSPLAAFAQGFSTWDERQQRVEAETKSCMEKKGWKYTPWIRPKSYLFYTVEEMQAKRVETGRLIPATSSENPNMAYVLALSHAQQARYSQDLEGGSREGDRPGSPATGCKVVAEQKVVEEIPYMNPASSEFVRTKMREVQDRQLNENSQPWQACMHARNANAESNPARTMSAQRADQEGTSAQAQNGAAHAKAFNECESSTTLASKQRDEKTVINEIVARYPQYQQLGNDATRGL